MEEMSCLISDCTATANSEFTVNEHGLLTVYAVCGAHLVAIRNGGMYPEPKNPTRGLLGLRKK